MRKPGKREDKIPKAKSITRRKWKIQKQDTGKFLMEGIYEVNFGYNSKMVVYTNLSSYIPELYDIAVKK